MVFREALLSDIPQIQIVRHSVKENVLSDPALVSDEDCAEYITIRGKGWVCEMNGIIAGFAIADLKENNIWALFLRPEFEGKGIGRKLHDIMLTWYFAQTEKKIWLGTAPATRAEKFYTAAGWKNKGLRKNGEVLFEMEHADWKNIIASPNKISI
ncbi:MAG: GNAT family N-acetyltransferase [Chitinophagales bacterium]